MRVNCPNCNKEILSEEQYYCPECQSYIGSNVAEIHPELIKMALDPTWTIRGVKYFLIEVLDVPSRIATALQWELLTPLDTLALSSPDGIRGFSANSYEVLNKARVGWKPQTE